MNNETEEFYGTVRESRTVGQEDAVNHPSHYAEGWSNGAEVIDIAENLNFNRGNAVKYICRAGRKSKDTEAEDLRKAAWYINRELERLAGEARK